ncbi:MAG: hypothetical protein MI923_20385 [Phycisphaerales bacterium]|nr:hypothetical protein [Phycisphaerales bacterium]
MGLQQRHGYGGVEIGATKIGGIESMPDLDTGTEVRGGTADAAVYPSFNSVTGQNPTGTFETRALKTAIDALGQLGVNLATSPLKVYVALRQTGGTFDVSAAHRLYTMNHGIVVPGRISGNHQGDYTMGFDATITYDGVNEPIIPADDAALPAGFDDTERFTLGPIEIGGVALSGDQSVEIDFAINVNARGATSDIWPTLASIVPPVEPTITIRGIDQSWFSNANIPLLGKKIEHLDTTIYFRKRLDGGGFVPDATAEHISLSVAGTAYIGSALTDDDGDAGQTLMVKPSDDGANDVLKFNTATAIAA